MAGEMRSGFNRAETCSHSQLPSEASEEKCQGEVRIRERERERVSVCVNKKKCFLHAYGDIKFSKNRNLAVQSLQRTMLETSLVES